MAEARGKLKVVPEGARPRPRGPKKVVDAADLGRRDLLVAIRHRLASDMDAGVPAHALAPIARQLQEIDREIRALDSAKEEDNIGRAAATPDEDWEAI